MVAAGYTACKVSRLAVDLRAMKIAIVHDWLTGMRGGEKVLASVCALLPDADVHTLVHVPGSVSPTIEQHRIYTSFLQRLPRIRRYYRWCLPLMPFAVERLDMSAYDAVFSISHCVAKSVRVPPGVPHVCYCLSPMRYLWSLQEEYFARSGRWSPTGLVMRCITPWLRNWDRRTAGRVTDFVAISRFIAERIRDAYGRSSQVLYPPVDATYYHPDAAVGREDFFLCVSALAPYKRLDLAVKAFNELQLPLKIVGSGQDEATLRTLAGATIEFLGQTDDTTIRDLYRRAAGFVFPGCEDFGITPLEAQACGCPVIAFAAGGALETVIDADAAGHRGTGVFFHEPTVDSLAHAVRRVADGRVTFDPDEARTQALRFDIAVFERQMAELLTRNGFPVERPIAPPHQPTDDAGSATDVMER